MRLVQLARAAERRVAMVDGEQLRMLQGEAGVNIYSLASAAMERSISLTSLVESAVGNEVLPYDSVYEGASPWRLLPSFDHPSDPARCSVSGTGLTHKASAENRAAMHKKTSGEITDSIRMYQMGLETGNPARGQVGLQPEWFYKGRGSVLRAHGEELTAPSDAWDGGEEPGIAGVYIISSQGEPFRVGFTVANEFSDH